MANPPNPQRPDLEDLVAFLEGRGSEAMRALVLKRLDEDPDYLATMNDLVPMLREAGLIPEGGIASASPEAAESEPKPNVIGDPSRFRRRTGLIAIAAAVVPIGVGLWLWMGSSARFPNQPMPPIFDSAQLQSWNSILDSETWGDTSKVERGDGSEPASSLEPLEVLSLRLIGAQIFDLEAAVRAQNQELAEKRLQVLQVTLGEKKSTTYGGLSYDKGWAAVEEEMTEAYDWLDRPKGFEHAQLEQIDKGICLRAAFLAQKAGNPDFTKSWTGACREALRDLDLQVEIEEMRKQFGPPDDDLDSAEDGAAEAPPS